MADVEIRFDPAFVEEAVFLELRRREAAGDHLTAQAFHAQRGALYDDAGGKAAEREARFQQLAARSFQGLGFTELFAKRFEEFPLIGAQVPVALVQRAWSRKEERVELYVPSAPSGLSSAEVSPTLLIGLQVARCLNREPLVAFLRHELMHIADLLDPAFGCQPHPDFGAGCETEEDLIRERFRLLWNLVVDGRMRRKGWPAVDHETTRLRECERAFASWDPQQREAVWRDLGNRASCAQRELLELAKDERLTRMLGQGGVRCPLCHFPTREGVCDWRGERASVAEAIQADYAWWDPAQGACRQCFELYRSRWQMVR